MNAIFVHDHVLDAFTHTTIAHNASFVRQFRKTVDPAGGFPETVKLSSTYGPVLRGLETPKRSIVARG